VTLDAQAESMRSNWQNGLDRFKALQAQARTTRDERNALVKTVEELKAQIEAGGNSDEVVAAATVRAWSLPLSRHFASL